MEEEVPDHPITKFERFKRWARKYLGKVSGAAILVGGVVTSIVLSLKNMLRKGASAVGGFAKAMGKLALKSGPMLSSVFGLIAKMAELGAKGIGWLGSNLWFMLVFAGLYLYDKYKYKFSYAQKTKTCSKKKKRMKKKCS